MRKNKTIDDAVKAMGGLNELAAEVGVKRAMVYQWVKGLRPVAAHHCIPIERATNGVVTRYDLRPDVFGEAPGKAA